MKGLKEEDFKDIVAPRLLCRGQKNLTMKDDDSSSNKTSLCVIECYSDGYVRISGFSNRMAGSGSTRLYFPVTFTNDSNCPFVTASPIIGGQGLQTSPYVLSVASKTYCGWDVYEAAHTGPFHFFVEGYAVLDEQFLNLCKELSL